MSRISRRTFAKGIVTTGAAMAMQQAGAGEVQPTKRKWQGVNLGSWLVLERWMIPSFFEGIKAQDEYQFGEELGAKAAEKLRVHRETYITEDDFKWIAERGLNAVRLPVGYWALKDEKPFVSCVEYVDKAFEMAHKNRLKVLLDLHAAPGSQNGWDHSGRSGEIRWYKEEKNITQTLDAVEALTKRYAKHPALMGVELLNEPRWDVPIEILKDYYTEGYKRVRRHASPEKVAVIFHDGFRHNQWKDFLQPPDFANVLLDTHLYQCYTEEDRKLNAQQHAEKARGERRRQVAETKAQLPTIVGEWSVALDPASLKGLSEKEQDAAIREYGNAQRETYETASGWFYWTYKTESAGAWGLRECVKRGWMPDKFA